MTILDSIAASFGYTRPRKAERGPGVIPMMHDTHMSDLFGRGDQAKALAAQALYLRNPWVNAAERAVTAKCAGVSWHLEDEDDHEIDDAATPEQRSALDLIERPQATLPRGATQGLTRRELWTLTSRHMGMCGTAFWYGDQMSVDLIPAAFLYINPSRMTPVENPAGYLLGWKLDAVPYNPDSGYPLTLDEVYRFRLEPADTGHFGIGLAEASGILSELWMLAARHSGGVLGSGGRIAGITMPKTGVEMSDDAWTSLVRDMRTIAEDPNAAKRNLIIKKPMDFVPTAASPKDLDLIASLELARDDVLGYWGVPKTQIGLEVAAGLNNGGATKDRDEAVLWKGPVHARLVAFAEVIQYQLLDRWKARGVTLELEIEEPDFTEDKPKYDNAAMALSQPLRNRERRAILGLDPLGDPALDEAVWMPITMTAMFTAPDVDGNVVELPEEVVEPSTIEAKATVGKRPLLGLRRQVAAKWTPRVRSSVADVLDAQRTEIAAKVKRNAAHLLRKPTDSAVWWDGPKWDRLLEAALKPHVSAIVEQVTGHVESILAPKLGKAAPVWAEPVFVHAVGRLGKRITGINGTTRDDVIRTVQATVKRGLDEGMGAAALGDALEDALADAATFGEYRAELIARTETAQVYNSAALESYGEFGVDMVEPIDGDDDPECQARLARGPVSLAEAEADEDHPNGTLDWVPYFPEDEAPAKAAPVRPVVTMDADVAKALLDLATREVPVYQPQPVYVTNHPAEVNVHADAPPVVIEKGAIQVTNEAQPAPVINVAPSEPGPAPVVNVNVPTAKATTDIVNVRIVEAPLTRQKIVRDYQGRIVEVEEMDQ